jgi:hypothetical protein
MKLRVNRGTDKPKEKMIKCPCPGCSSWLPENDFRIQMQHVGRNHPELVTERLYTADTNPRRTSRASCI